MGSTCVDDCYFYYYSSCTKGSDCPFRHCEAALGTETVCTLWREGLCYRNNCKFRHMESRINRSSIPCYWENQPGGCRKPHCVFFHHKDRTNLNVFTKTEGLILPISSQPVSPGKTIDSSADTKMESNENLSLSPPHSIQPVVVSLGEAEESDTESTTTTPIKIISSLGKKTPSPMKCASVPTANVASYEEDLGIKTLEQIRMEKIHRESEHFYNPGDCFLSAGKTGVIDADASEECASFETMHTESNGYYPQEYSTTEEELISNNLEMESYQDDGLYPMEMNSVVQSCSDSPKSAPGDLRQILKKKRHVPEKERFPKKLPTKRIISLKKSGASEELSDVVCVVKTQLRNQEDDIGFRVKTLDEIRREKEKKQQGGMSPPPSVEAEMQDEEDDVDKPITNLSHQFKEPSVENKTKPDGDKPIINISRQVKIRSVENKTKPDGDKPIINISRQVKIQSVENKTKPDGDKPIINIKIQSVKNKTKPEGSKRKLCRKPLELYKPVHRIQKDMEENARMLERYSTLIGDDSVSDDEDATKNITQEIIPCKEESQSNNSLKRACDSDMPVAPKIKRTVTLQMVSLQKLSAPGSEEEKPSRLVVPDQKNDNSLTFKRRNIIRRKNLNNVPSSQSSVTDEDSNSQFQNSDSQTELSVQTSKLSVLSSQNGTHMDSSDFREKTDVEMSDEKEKASNIASPPPSVPMECENKKGSLISSTFDEYDTLFLSTESDIGSNETGGSTVPKAEDLFLEFEKIIQS